ncbi:hypothetical protein ACJJTC_003223 [Scirpophaga incertulas]
MSSQKQCPKRKSIQTSDPGKILELVIRLTDDNCAMLQIKVNAYLAEECEAELVFLLIVNTERMEAYIDAVGITALQKRNKILMTPKLTEIMDALAEYKEMFTSFGTDFQAVVAPFIDKEPQKKRIMMYPVPDKPFSVIVCVVAPKVQEEHVAMFVQECFLFSWPTLKKAILYENESILKTKCQQLLKVAKKLFTQVASLDILMNIVMEQAKHLAKAEHCLLLLIDLDKMELVDSKNIDKELNTVPQLRFPLDKGIAGHVISTGRLVNAKVAKEHPAFNPTVDCRPGIECRTMMCFPVREQTGIIGVCQLINKIGEPYFDGLDEELALAFGVYSGVCIAHSAVHEKVREAHIRNVLANELVMYHMNVGDSEVQSILQCTGFHGHPHGHSLHFNVRALPPRELPCYALKMFSELGFDRRFSIKRMKLARFILRVKKGYRDVPYHNWLHGFSVAQWAYAAIFNFSLISKGYLTDLQALMYVIAGFVHDLDHRGTTNSFQLEGQTTLAALYSSEGSVMERHHLAQAMCIINTEGCDILEALPRPDYDRAIMMLKDYILATDLANYFRNIPAYMCIASEYQNKNRTHSAALQALLMNAADLSDQLKDWGSVKKSTALILKEFFREGDLQKTLGELPPIAMDRDRCFIPDLAIQFIKTTCIPLYETLGKIIPKAIPFVNLMENHIERWEAAIPVFEEVPATSGISVLLSPELDNLIEINIHEKERLRLEAEAAQVAAAAVAAEEQNKED